MIVSQSQIFFSSGMWYFYGTAKTGRAEFSPLSLIQNMFWFVDVLFNFPSHDKYSFNFLLQASSLCSHFLGRFNHPHLIWGQITFSITIFPSSKSSQISSWELTTKSSLFHWRPLLAACSSMTLPIFSRWYVSPLKKTLPQSNQPTGKLSWTTCTLWLSETDYSSQQMDTERKGKKW